MIVKLNLEQFRQFKSEMQNIIRRYEKLEEENRQLAEERMPQVVEEYFSIQNQLLSYELSDIPFEEWEDLSILGDENHIADFSSTNANIDFHLLDYSGYGNFRGCNIRSLETLNPTFLEHSIFSEGVVERFVENIFPNTFSLEWKQKYFARNITIEDLASLNASQLEELSRQNLDMRLSSNQDLRLIHTLGLEKACEFYRYSNQEYSQAKDVVDMLFHHMYRGTSNISDQLKTVSIDKIKETLFSVVRNNLLESTYALNVENLPPAFVTENRDILLLDNSIPVDIKERYYHRKLTLEDLRDFPDAFMNIPIEYFTNEYNLQRMLRILGTNNLLKLIPKYFDVIKHIIDSEEIFSFERVFHLENDIELDFIQSVKKYFKENYLNKEGIKTVEAGKNLYSIPEWLSSMPFSVYDSISSEEDFMNLLSESTNPIILNNNQDEFIEMIGISNLRRFEQENGFFSYKKYSISNGLFLIKDMNQAFKELIDNGAFSKDLSYEEFQNVLAKFLDKYKKYLDYNYIQGDFRNNHSEIFIDEDVPLDLQAFFYSQLLSPRIVFEHPEYISYLRGKNLENCFQEMFVNVKNPDNNIDKVNFYELLSDKMDFNDVLFFIRDYSDVLEAIKGHLDEPACQLETNGDIPKFLLEFGNLFRTVITEKGIPYPKRIPKSIKENFPSMFLEESVPENIREKFYKRMLKAEDFEKQPDLLEMIGNTNIAYGFLEAAWVSSIFLDESDMVAANTKRLKIISAYLKLEDILLKKEFKQYILDCGNSVDMHKVDFVSQVLDRLAHSNSSEIFTFRESLTRQILSSPTPIDTLNKIEDVFLKNNIPTVGKIYSSFHILHPNFEGFNFDKSMVSPTLKRLSNRGREIVIFSDLIKASFGSNNKSVNSYLDNIELGSRLYEEVLSGEIQYEGLDEYAKKELLIFSKHLATLYNNTVKGKMEKESFQHSGNPMTDILKLSELLSPNGTLDYNLADRVVKMFCGFMGIETLEEAKNYIHSTITNAEKRNRIAAQTDMQLEKGDFIKGIGDIHYLKNILQNGSVSKEYLGANATSDSTPLDTDVSMILKEEGTIEEKMNATASKSYGPIWFVLKNNHRFITTRSDSLELEAKRDLSKLEVFYTGTLGKDHYGIRTGFASTEIDYIVMDSFDQKVGLEIVMNGFYIPVVNKQGKIIFTPEDYDNLKAKMSGLSYFGETNYCFSENLVTEEIETLVNLMEESSLDVKSKQSKINSIISNCLSELGLHLKSTIDGDLTDGFVELIDTGSTGRGTNKPGDGDFDYMMRVDKSILLNHSKFYFLRKKLLQSLAEEGSNNVTFGGDFRLKKVQIDPDTIVDIDITFVEKTDKISYSTDMSLQDRLSTIQRLDPEKYKYVLANILLAKNVLKAGEAYKPNRGEVPQGGLGGVGIENWVLQNGGSFLDAAKSFMEVAKEKSFAEFKQVYQVWDFGENHLAARKGNYAHDNFVANNMSEVGYEKMKRVLYEYLQTYKYEEDYSQKNR